MRLTCAQNSSADQAVGTLDADCEALRLDPEVWTRGFVFGGPV